MPMAISSACSHRSSVQQNKEVYITFIHYKITSQYLQFNTEHTMTGRGIVSGSPSLPSGMPKRAPVAAGDGGLGQSVQSSPLLVLRLNTWRILIGDFRLFLVLLVRPDGFFESALHSLVFLLLLWRIRCFKMLYLSFPNSSPLQYLLLLLQLHGLDLRSVPTSRVVFCMQYPCNKSIFNKISLIFCIEKSKTQKDLVRLPKYEICYSIWSVNKELMSLFLSWSSDMTDF